MKKFTTTLVISLFLLSIVTMQVFAATPTVNIAGPATLRAGDTIKLEINVNGSGIQFIQGKIRYDNNQLTYESNSEKLTGWAVDIENSSGEITFLGVDDKLTAPINSSKKIFSVTFTVKSGVSTGTSISVTTTDLSASDGTNDFSPSDATYTKSVSAPLSTNNNLSNIIVNNTQITPTFASGTTNYTATVPFSVTKLDITAIPEDGTAKAVILNNTLKVGKTSVVVAVTAQNGAKKTYSITVTREQDPNYQASNNANLKSIIPSIGILSPVFSADTKQYYVYLPYEVTSFEATGQTQDSQASVNADASLSLAVGDNTYTITCMGEDGTELEYHITVMRMPKAGEEMPQATATPTIAPITSTPEVSDVSEGTLGEDGQTPVGLIVLVALIALIAGGAVGYFLIPGKNR